MNIYEIRENKTLDRKKDKKDKKVLPKAFKMKYGYEIQ